MAASDWSERTRMMVTVGVGVAANLVLGYFLYSAHGSYSDLEKKNKAKQAEVQSLHAIVDERPMLEAKLKKRKRDLQKKESMLPEIGDVEKLIESISERGQQSGATLLAFTKVAQPVTEGGPGASYEKTIYKTRWQADFMSWCKLMNSMEEKFPRFIAFENLVLTPPNSGIVPMGAKHDISVDVVVYRYVRQQQ